MEDDFECQDKAVGLFFVFNCKLIETFEGFAMEVVWVRRPVRRAVFQERYSAIVWWVAAQIQPLGRMAEVQGHSGRSLQYPTRGWCWLEQPQMEQPVTSIQLRNKMRCREQRIGRSQRWLNAWGQRNRQGDDVMVFSTQETSDPLLVSGELSLPVWARGWNCFYYYTGTKT